MIQATTIELASATAEIPKVDPQILSVTHQMLDALASKPPEMETQNIYPEDTEVHAHRWSGAAPHASTIQAVRRALSDQSLPEYRELANAEIEDSIERNPAIHLNLFSEVGPFARLDSLHRQKIAAIALWKPKISTNFIVHLYPLFVDLTATSTGDTPLSYSFKPGESDEMRVKNILDLYDQFYKNKPPPVTDIEKGDQVLIQNPQSDITRLMGDIDLKGRKAGETHLFTFISQTVHFPNRRYIRFGKDIGELQLKDYIWVLNISPDQLDYFNFTSFPRYKL